MDTTWGVLMVALHWLQKVGAQRALAPSLPPEMMEVVLVCVSMCVCSYVCVCVCMCVRVLVGGGGEAYTTQQFTFMKPFFLFYKTYNL